MRSVMAGLCRLPPGRREAARLAGTDEQSQPKQDAAQAGSGARASVLMCRVLDRERSARRPFGAAEGALLSCGFLALTCDSREKI